MNKNTHKTKNNALLPAGFALLFAGILLVSNDNTAMQVVGVVLLIAASALFGASIGAQTSQKK